MTNRIAALLADQSAVGRRKWLEHLLRERARDPVSGCTRPGLQAEALERGMVEIAYIANLVREKMGTKAKSNKFLGDVLWVNRSLTVEEKSQFLSWDIETEEAVQALAAWVMGGYRFSASFKADQQTFSMSLIGGEGAQFNSGKGVSTFARDWDTALKLLVFKVQVLLPSEWEVSPTLSGSAFG